VATLVLAILSLVALALFSKRLLFASLLPELAESRGISLTGLSSAFMVILGIAVTLASQVVGILLVFTLVIGPAGIAARFCRGFWSSILISILIGLFSVWTGILLACVTNWPPSFWITAIIFTLYLIGETLARYVFRLER